MSNRIDLGATRVAAASIQKKRTWPGLRYGPNFSHQKLDRRRPSIFHSVGLDIYRSEACIWYLLTTYVLGAHLGRLF
jgi:hypothetical protein